MKKLTKLISFILTLLFLFGFAQTTLPLTVRELLENAKKLDNTEVRFQGEVIGQRLNAGTYVWINVLDQEGNAIGIWMSRVDSEKITFYGNHKTSGDKIQIEGIFHKICLEHGGDTDIHLTKLVKIEKGKSRLASPVYQFFLYAIPCLTILTFYFFNKKRKNELCNLTDR